MPFKLLEVKNLSIAAQGKRLVDDINFSLNKAEVLGIIGQSGSGKSLLAKSLLGLLPPSLVQTGELKFKGKRLNPAKLRGKQICLIPQDIFGSLDPSTSIKGHFKQGGILNKNTPELLFSLGFKEPNKTLNSHAYSLSGGERLRVLIALALSAKPELIIADEPTSALDSILAARALELFKKINKELKTAFIFITHDLKAASFLSDKILLMHSSKQLELIDKELFFLQAKSEQAKELIRAKDELFKRFKKCFM